MSFRKQARQAAIAWVVSFTIHALLFVIMFAFVFSFAPAVESIPPITRAELVGELDATGESPTPMSDWAKQQSTQAAQQLHPLTPKPLSELSDLNRAGKPDLPILGIGSGGGDFSQYGLGVRADPSPEFFGLGRQARGARRIVYVVDRSGSMLDTFDYVRKELKRSVSQLRRSQKFHVIFFSSGRPIENPPGRMVSAILAHKKSLYDFVQRVLPDGGTDPIPAMRRALSTDPDVVYFLTDGQFDPALLEGLEEWNADRRVRIFTIAFFNDAGAELLEEIARRHNGEFKFITEDDIED